MSRVSAGLGALALLVSGAGYAQAELGQRDLGRVGGHLRAPMAAGSVGAIDLVLDGVSVTVDPMAACETGEVEQATSPGVEVDDFLEFDGGSTTCSVDETTEVSTASVTGERFRLEGLEQYGGPRLIRLSSFSVFCATTETGSSATFQLSGLTGVTVPSEIPPNYVVTIPGPAGAPPIATVTFNETLIPSPPDGSMAVNVMHIRLFPEGPTTQHSGDILVGSVNCAP